MSSSTSLVPIAPAKPPPKRKRSSDLATISETPTNPVRKPRDGPKKKKANRACFHCQKAHLTCDDSRPCQRCIKRGIANSCTEGHRKKAKYLLDDAELEQLKRNKTNAKSSSTSSAPAPAVPVENPSLPLPSGEAYPQDNAALDLAFDPNFPFGSEAANLEYSILSAILGNPSPPQDTQTPPSSYPSWSSDSIQFPRHSPPFTTFATDPSSLSYTYQEPTQTSEFAGLYHASISPPSSQTVHPLQPRWPLDSRPRSPPLSPQVPLQPINENPHGLLSPPHSNASPSLQSSNPHTNPESSKRPGIHSGSKLQSINDRITKPYDYTEGYHFLMKHLPTRFEKNDILRIVRALAIFRPSLIALQMPLSLDDEVFVEKCFQRSLLELEKLISYSGTPTAVWRRTGEICLVGPEFCMLTEWPMEELVGKKKYIYELFENQSVVEYWENFASHAFENSTQSVYSHCVLLKPSGAPVPATFCFSIRRDLFDLPSVVIGQWLPLL